MHPRVQGDIGEASAIAWLAQRGAFIFPPLFRSPDYDLVAEIEGRLVRIEVKTSNSRTRVGNWSVAVCTRGGNQSWNKITKRFDPERCDFLFVHVGDGRRWLIPATRVEGTTAIVVGGRKYAEFEIESGPPLPAETDQSVASTIACSCARGDVRVAKGDAL
jgi:Holliday junction resolvase-like predicted endonuclease